MKIRMAFKDPDCFSEAVFDAVSREVSRIPGLSDGEARAIAAARSNDVWEVLSRWVEYQEYVTIDFDTEAKTATVVPRPA
jgi:hypothetical protein